MRPGCQAFVKFARNMGVTRPPGDVPRKLLTVAGANAVAFSKVLSFHAVAGSVPASLAAKLVGQSVNTLLTTEFESAKLTVATKGSSNLELQFAVANLGNGNGPGARAAAGEAGGRVAYGKWEGLGR
jgi:hypothetical protein